MHKIKISLLSIIAIGSIIQFSACKDKPTPQPSNVQEEIDRVDVFFVKSLGGILATDTVKMYFNEAGTPSPASVTLSQNTSYKMYIVPSQGGVSKVKEIQNEGHEHQFFFFPNPASSVTNYVYDDKDKDNRGIGQEGTISFGTGDLNLKIVLRHSLNKAHSGAATYNSATYQAAGGEDDLNMTAAIKLVP